NESMLAPIGQFSAVNIVVLSWRLRQQYPVGKVAGEKASPPSAWPRHGERRPGRRDAHHERHGAQRRVRCREGAPAGQPPPAPAAAWSRHGERRPGRRDAHHERHGAERRSRGGERDPRGQPSPAPAISTTTLWYLVSAGVPESVASTMMCIVVPGSASAGSSTSQRDPSARISTASGDVPASRYCHQRMITSSPSGSLTSALSVIVAPAGQIREVPSRTRTCGAWFAAP